MANTFNEYTATTGQSEFEYTFPTLNLDHVIVSVDGADSDQNTADNPPTAYEFTITETPTKKVILNTAPGSGKLVRVYRNTQGLNNTSADPLVDFTDGSILTESDLDTAVRQALYIAQEQSDIQIGTAGAAAGSLLAYNASTSKWEVIPINLQYDSTNGTFGFGGTPATGYTYTLHGDTIIKDGTGEARLVIENTSTASAILEMIAQNPTAIFQDTNGATDDKHMHIGLENGILSFAPYTEAGALKTIGLQLDTEGGVYTPNIPTTDPSVANQVFSRNGQLAISGSSRYIYDSGWVTQWNTTTLAANAFDAVTMTTAVDGYFPFNIQIWGRLASSPNEVYPLNTTAVAQSSATGTVGVQAKYNESTRDLTLYFQDVPVWHEVTSGVGSTLLWGTGIDEIRVTIT